MTELYFSLKDQEQVVSWFTFVEEHFAFEDHLLGE